MRRRWIAGLLILLLAVAVPYTASAAVWGDANGDGRFSARDTVMVLQYISGREMALTSTADVSGDAEVTAVDILIMLRGMIKPTVSVTGFELPFDWEQDYYVCFPTDFSACTIRKHGGFLNLVVEVEQYAGHTPYATTPYRVGEPLKLGYGTARMTLTGKLPDGATVQYDVLLADPNSEGYALRSAKVVSSSKLRSKDGTELTKLKAGERVLYLKTEGNRCLVQQLDTGVTGYLARSAVQWSRREVAMPAEYKDAVNAMKSRHPNWSFTFVDVEMSLEQAVSRYGSGARTYIDPKYYLNESRIFAMLDVRGYTESRWIPEGISKIWKRTTAVSKEEAVEYFSTAARLLQLNPYYITCRAALESGYGTSRFATGTVGGYSGYYNFYGISCYDSNPTVGAAYAQRKNWTSKERAIIGGAAWVKEQYVDQGAVTPYFFRYAGFQNKEYMSDYTAPYQEAAMLRPAYANGVMPAHFIIPVYR